MAARIRIGISSCLLGEKVRYDGADKRAPYLAGLFGDDVEWVAVCPEVEMGLGVPREPIHLFEGDGGLRLVGLTTGADYTAKMREYITGRLEALAPLGLCGYIFKKNSPSCDVTGVEVWSAEALPTLRQAQGRPEPRRGAKRVARRRGMFAQAIVDRFPGLPVEDEERLADPRVRAKFVERVLTYARGRQGGASSAPTSQE